MLISLRWFKLNELHLLISADESLAVSPSQRSASQTSLSSLWSSKRRLYFSSHRQWEDLGLCASDSWGKFFELKVRRRSKDGALDSFATYRYSLACTCGVAYTRFGLSSPGNIRSYHQRSRSQGKFLRRRYGLFFPTFYFTDRYGYRSELLRAWTSTIGE